MTIYKGKNKNGFIALIAIILLISGTTAFSTTTLFAAMNYSDQVIKRQYRIQARMNMTACIDAVYIMSKNDYFIKGKLRLREFGCMINILNDFYGNIHIEAVTEFVNVRSYSSDSWSI